MVTEIGVGPVSVERNKVIDDIAKAISETLHILRPPCPECGNKLDWGTIFCPGCGAHIETTANKIVIATCPKCGHKIGLHQKVCTNCGTNLVEVCSVCNNKVGLDAIFCPACGAKIIEVNKYLKIVQNKLQSIIYNLYHRDPKLAGYFNDIKGIEVKTEYAEEVRKLDTIFKDRLKQAYDLVHIHTDMFTINTRNRGGSLTGWVQVNPKFDLDVTRRMYLNVMPEHINLVVFALVNLMLHGFQSNKLPQIIFKFPNPVCGTQRELIRADKVVVYYGNDAETHKILSEWSHAMGKYFHSDTPLFTTKIVDGVGFAYEPPPEQHEYTVKHTGEMASFGSFMSLVIGRYLHAWILHNKKIPNDAEMHQIAAEIYHYKLMKEHKYKFE